MTNAVSTIRCRYLPFKKTIGLALMLLGLVGMVRPAAAASFVVQQPSFSPSTVPLGQSFTFSFNLYSPVVLSNVIIAMDIRDTKGNLLLQKSLGGQNFQVGQVTSYAWTGTIPASQTSPVPFAAGGNYKMMIYIFNSNWTSQYVPAITAAAFTVSVSSAAAPPAGTTPPSNTYGAVGTNVGYAAAAPIQPPAGTGKTYYVSDPGNAVLDKANRALLPAGATIYSTIQAAANVTQPGDTVLVMNGTYGSNPAYWVDGVVTINTSGSAAGGYITYAAYPGHHPVVTTSNNLNTWDDFEIYASYIVVRGFEAIGNAQNVTLAQANASTATEEAILQQEAAAGKPATYPTGTPGRRADNGNCIDGLNNVHVIIMNNLVHDCSANGIGFTTSDYITMEANTVYNTSWWSMYDTSGIGLHYALNSDSSTGYKNFVLNNLSYNNANTQPFLYSVYNNYVRPGSAAAAPSDGNGINIDTNQTSNNGSPYMGRTLVAGNIAYGNGGSGIHAYHSSHVDMINNTAFMNDTCPVPGSTCGGVPTTVNGVTITGVNNGQLYSMDGVDNNIFDNILYAPAGKYVYTNWGNTNVVENNNIFYSADGQVLMNGYKKAAQDIAADPLFSNKGNPAQNYFALAAASPALHAGNSYVSCDVSTPSLLKLPVVNGKVNIGAAQ